MLRTILLIMLLMGVDANGSGGVTYGSVDGIVRDHNTGKPLPCAHITLHAGLAPLTATTDSSGRFTIIGVPQGKGFRLEIRHPDYGEEIISVDVDSGSVSRVQVALSTPVLRLVTPNGGEVLFAGSEYRICWYAAGVDSVKISFSADGGRSWLPVESNVDARLEEYVWDIPDVPGTSCLIRIEAMDDAVTDISDGYFRVGST